MHRTYIAIGLAGSVLLALACGDLNSIQSPDPDPAGSGRVSGLCQRDDGSAAAGVYVIFERKADGRRFVTQTDGSGAFDLPHVAAGSYTGVVSDMKGFGAVGDYEVLAGGHTRLDEITLAPLEKIKPAFLQKNIWFEERITDSAGDHIDPRTSKGAVFAVSFQHLPGNTKADLVRTDLASGKEQTLVKDEDVAGQDYFSRWVDLDNVPAFSEGLLADRFALYYGYRPDEKLAGSKSEHLVSFDLQTQKSVVVPLLPGTSAFTPELEQHICPPYSPPQSCYDTHIESRIWIHNKAFAGSTLSYLQTVGRKTAKPATASFDIELGRQLEVCTFSLETGVRQCAAVNPSNGYRTLKAARLTEKWALMQLGAAACGYPPADPTCFQSQPIVVVELATLSKRVIAQAGALEFSLATGGDTLYYSTDSTASGSQLYSVDLASGQEKLVASAGSTLSWLTPAPDGKHLVAMSSIVGAPGYVVVDLVSGGTTSVPNQVSYQGQALSGFQACSQKDSSCYSADGKDFLAYLTLTAQDYLKRFGQPSKVDAETLYLMLHVPVDGSAPFVVETGVFPWGGYLTAPAVSSSGGTYRAQLQRVKATGFYQLFVTRLSDGLERQVTFITAQHSIASWAQDGVHVVYLARDPVSGYTQLFRVNAELFFAPEKASGI
jgi:hypothetical protein